MKWQRKTQDTRFSIKATKMFIKTGSTCSRLTGKVHRAFSKDQKVRKTFQVPNNQCLKENNCTEVMLIQASEGFPLKRKFQLILIPWKRNSHLICLLLKYILLDSIGRNSPLIFIFRTLLHAAELWGLKKCLTVFHPFIYSFQFSSVAQSCPTLCNPMNRSAPGLSVHHQLSEFTQTHAHRVGDAIQPSHPRSSPSPPAPNPSQHQSLFQ